MLTNLHSIVDDIDATKMPRKQYRELFILMEKTDDFHSITCEVRLFSNQNLQ